MNKFILIILLILFILFVYKIFKVFLSLQKECDFVQRLQYYHYLKDTLNEENEICHGLIGLEKFDVKERRRKLENEITKLQGKVYVKRGERK